MARFRIVVRLAAAGLVIAGLVVGPSATAAGPAAAVDCDGQPVTITGTEGDDELVGTPGPDVIAALGGDDLVRGRGGDDIICGEDGSDKLVGGAGDDRLFGGDRGETGDTLVGGAGSDYLDGGGDLHRAVFKDEPAGIHADLQTGIVTTSRGTDTIALPDDVVFYASHFADVIDGGRGDTVFAKGGDDTLTGGGGYNRLFGGPGNDALTGGPEFDSLYGKRGDDVLDSVGVGLDAILKGGAGDDHLIGTVSWDFYLYGGPGNDLIEGFGGGDRLFGRTGDDTLDGGTGTDKGRAGGGTDTCLSIEEPHDCEHPGPTG